jgi:predicted nuclease of predicted toxin-antitoxin system
MRLLLDANLSPRLKPLLQSAGYDVSHVADVGLLHASDSIIFEFAAAEAYAIVTADSDFAMMLALRRTTSPSVIHLRRIAELSPEAHAALLIANLPTISADLDRGVIVSLSPTRLAVRDLPIG